MEREEIQQGKSRNRGNQNREIKKKTNGSRLFED
jgi:hypothetical protein